MNKTEIQARIEELQADFDSKLASLNAELAKCDCEDGIEKEKCWQASHPNKILASCQPRTKQEIQEEFIYCRPAYMPECRQVTAEDARIVDELAFLNEGDANEFAYELHRRGFRIKVMP